MFKINEDGSFEIVRGDSASFRIRLYTKSGSGTPTEYIPQEGDTFLFTVKKNTKTEDVIFQKSGPNVDISPEDTEGLTYGKYVYDVQFTYASGFRDTVIRPSTFTILEEVTF